MVLGINLSFGGGMGGMVLGLVFMAGAAYLDGTYVDYGRFHVLYWVGVLAFFIGIIFSSISYFYWVRFTSQKMEYL